MQIKGTTTSETSKTKKKKSTASTTSKQTGVKLQTQFEAYTGSVKKKTESSIQAKKEAQPFSVQMAGGVDYRKNNPEYTATYRDYLNEKIRDLGGYEAYSSGIDEYTKKYESIAKSLTYGADGSASKTIAADSKKLQEFNRTLREYFALYKETGGAPDGVNIDAIIKGLQDEDAALQRSYEDIQNNEKYYGQFKDEADYLQQKRDAEQAQKLLKMNVDSERSRINRLKEIQKQVEGIRAKYAAVYAGGAPFSKKETPVSNEEKQLLKEAGFSDLGALQNEISKSEKNIVQARVLQQAQTLDEMTEAAKADPAFFSISSTVERENQQRAAAEAKVGGGFWGMLRAANDADREQRERDNAPDLTAPFRELENEYAYELTPDEQRVYNYYLAKARSGEINADKARQYFEAVMDMRNQKGAQALYNKALKDNKALTYLYGGYAGLKSHYEGLTKWLDKDGYVAPSTTEYASGLAREALGETDAQGKRKWTAAQTAYDLIYTTANMLPSIAAGLAAGAVTGGVGTALGFGGEGLATATNIASKATSALSIGRSAGGQAYAEMLNEGYSYEQAKLYGKITGALEAGLEYALNGIGAVGSTAFSKVAGRTLGEAANGINNAFLRWAVVNGGKFLGEAGSEGLEEGLQDIIGPFVKMMITGEKADIDWSEVGYSAMLGALSAMSINSVTGGFEQGKRYGLVKDAIARGDLQTLSALGEQFDKNSMTSQFIGGVDTNKEKLRFGDRARLTMGLQATEGEFGGQIEREVRELINREGVTGEAENVMADVAMKSITGRKITDADIDRVKSLDVGTDGKDAMRIMSRVLNKAADYRSDVSGTISAYTSVTSKEKQQQGIDYAKRRAAMEKLTGKDISRTGKNIDRKNGVVPKKIAKIEDGKMTLELENGKTVNADEVKYRSSSDALLYEGVRMLHTDAETANALVQIGKIGARANRADMPYQVRDIQRAFRAGRTGNETAQPKAIGEGQWERIYEIGAKYDSNYDIKKRAVETFRAKEAAGKTVTEAERKAAVTLENELRQYDAGKKAEAAQKAKQTAENRAAQAKKNAAAERRAGEESKKEKTLQKAKVEDAGTEAEAKALTSYQENAEAKAAAEGRLDGILEKINDLKEKKKLTATEKTELRRLKEAAKKEENRIIILDNRLRKAEKSGALDRLEAETEAKTKNDTAATDAQGDELTLREIKDVRGGELRFVDSDGETVKLSEVLLENEETRTFLETLSRRMELRENARELTKESANEAFAAWKESGGADPEAFAEEWYTQFAAGAVGITAKQAATLNVREHQLTDAQMRQAWESGNRVSGFDAGVRLITTNELTDTQAAAVEVLEGIARKYGLNIAVADRIYSDGRLAVVNGFRDGSVLVLALETGAGQTKNENLLTLTAYHEAFHLLEQSGEEGAQFKRFLIDSVLDYLQETISEKDYAALFSDREAAYGRNRAKLKEEIAAQYLGTLMAQKNTAEIEAAIAGKMAETGNLTRWEKFVARLKAFVEDMRAGIAKLARRDSAVAAALGTDADAAEAFVSTFERALEAVKNKIPTGDGGVEYSIDRTKNMSWEKQINGYISLKNGKRRNIQRSDTLIMNDFSNPYSDNDLPYAFPLSTISYAQKGKDVFHQLKDETIFMLNHSIKNWNILINNPTRNAEVYISTPTTEDYPLLVAFDMDVIFDGDRVNRASSVHLQKDVVSMINNLPSDATIYIKNKTADLYVPGTSIKLEGLNTAARLVYIDNNTSKKKSQENKTDFSKDLSVVEESKDLIAVHNLESERLLSQLTEWGGFPAPSIAITKAKLGHTKYGDTTVIFDKNTIDPEKSRNVVYSGDAYTPTMPQVSYKISEKASQNLLDTYYDFSKKYGDKARALYPLGNYAEEEVNRKGIERITKDLKDDMNLREVYLLEKGFSLPEVETREEPVYAPAATQEEAQKIFSYYIFRDKYGKSLVDAFNKLEPGTGQWIRFAKEHTDEIRAAMVRSEVTNAENMSVRDVVRYFYDAIKYDPNKTQTVSDSSKRDAFIETHAEKEGYFAWIDSLLDGLIEKKGLYNGKDRYMPSGKRKSWEQLHYEYNLKNIVRAMYSTQEEQGAGFFGNNLFGASAQKYDSVDAIRSDRERLRSIDDEAYKNLKDEYIQRLGNIADMFAKNRNDWQNREAASDLLLEAVMKRRTRDGIAAYLKKEGEGWTRYSDAVVDSLISLVGNVRKMPTGYFEAKPARAVYADEIKGVVLPETSDKKLMDALDARGIPYLTYEYKNDADRIEKVNRLAEERDVEFSKDLDVVAEEELDRQSGQRDEVLEQTEILRGKAEKLTDEGLTPAQLRALVPTNNEIAGLLKKRNFAGLDGRALREQAATVRRMTENLFTGRTSFAGYIVDLTRLLQRQVERAGHWEDLGDVATRDFKKQARGSKIYLAPDIFKTVAENYGGRQGFRNAVMGKIWVTDDASKNRQGLDEWYDELRALGIVSLPETTDPGTQIEAVLDIFRLGDRVWIDDAKNNEWFGETAQEIAREEAYSLFGELTEATPTAKKLTADEAAGKRIQLLNEQLRAERKAAREEALAEARNAVENRAKELKNDADSRLAKARIEAEERVKAAERLAAQRIREAERRMQEVRETDRLKADVKRKVRALSKLLTANANYDNVPEAAKRTVTLLLEMFRTDRDIYSKQEVSDLAFEYNRILKGLTDEDETVNDVFAARLDTEITEAMRDMLEKLTRQGGATNVGETRILLRRLTAEQIRTVANAVDNITFAIRNTNKLRLGERQENAAALGSRAMQELGKRRRKITNKAADFAKDYLTVHMLTPSYFFNEKLGGVFKELFTPFVDGQDGWAVKCRTARDFFGETKEKYHYKDWKKESHDFLFQSDNVREGWAVTLPVGACMEIYAWKKREEVSGQESSHLLTDTVTSKTGGVVLDDEILKAQKKNLKQLKASKNEDYVRFLRSRDEINAAVVDKNRHKLTEGDIQQIVDSLTEEQKAYVDAIVGFMSTETSAWGNEATMEQYGIRKFTEGYYFPYETPKEFTNRRFGLADDTRLKNWGSAKRTVRKAHTPLVLSDFTEVAAAHVQEMALYSSFLTPIETMQTIFNYREADGDTSVAAAMTNAHGKAAVEYINSFLTAINGGLRSDSVDDIYNRMTGWFKRAAVMGNTSVVIQQPTAIMRAMAIINPKYFFGVAKKKDYADMLAHCPTAVVKEMGGFDTSMGVSAAEWILDDADWKRKVSDAFGWGAEKADAVTWTNIWNAVKRETKAKTDFAYGTEEFWNACNERFREIANYTQVYDSTLSKSELMRSRGGLAKMVTAFMAEPTLSYNLLVMSGKDKSIKKSRALTAFTLSVIVNAAFQSIVGAWRDKDEDETYKEKIAETFGGNLIGSRESWFMDSALNPLGLVPWVKDLISIFGGWDVNRSDVSVFSEIIKSAQKLAKAFGEGSVSLDKVMSFLSAASSLTGVPLKSLYKDMSGIIRTIKVAAMGDLKTDKTTMWTAFLEGIGMEKSADEQAYFAVLQGREEIIKRKSRYTKKDVQKYIDQGYSEKDAEEKAKQAAYNSWHNKVQAGLAACDPRIVEAADAKERMRYKDYERLIEEVKKDGFTQTDAVKAVEKLLKESETPTADEFDPDEEKDLFKKAELEAPIRANDKQAFDELSAALEEQGVEPKKISTAAKGVIKDMYRDGKIDEKSAETYLERYADVTGDDAYWTMKEWTEDGKDMDGDGKPDDYRKYNEFYAAVESGKNVKTVISDYEDHGVQKKTMASQITSHFKPIYKEMTNGERASLKGYLLNAYELLGYDRKKKAKDIDKWTEE